MQRAAITLGCALVSLGLGEWAMADPPIYPPRNFDAVYPRGTWRSMRSPPGSRPIP